MRAHLEERIRCEDGLLVVFLLKRLSCLNITDLQDFLFGYYEL